MYNIKLRDQFETVGGLKRLLEDVPEDTKIVICGDENCWFHIESNRRTICLDNSSLDDCYENPKKHYKVWLHNEYFEKYNLFERVSASELDMWLHQHCNFIDNSNWWIETHTLNLLGFNIPDKAMGYIVKYEEIQ